jgi:endonuclease YncB( thermonuclease family)
MPTALARSTYQTLLNDISRFYETASRSQVTFAWETGRRIVQVEQKGDIRAEYGVSLIPSLSADLTKKYGTGFSTTNLAEMRRFYLSNANFQPAGKLTWTNQVELSRIKDPKARKALERRALEEGLTKYDLRPLIREVIGTDGKPTKELPPLKRPTNLKLNTFRKADPKIVGLWELPRGQVLLDCGFFILHPVPEASLDGQVVEVPAYTYCAVVERVVDGDTLLVLIDAGFGNVVRERLRLRGMNTPELGTPEGDKAKRYVTGLLPAGSLIVIKTYRTDDYGRFVVDTFYKTGCNDPEEIIENGEYLNQVLLDKGYAVRMAE